jgi:hypothetical protein
VGTAAGVAASTKDVFIPPPPLTVADVAWTGRLGPGQNVTVELRRPETFAFTLAALVVFDGVIGQRATLTVTGLTRPDAEVSILKPDTTPLLRPVVIGRHGRSMDVGLPPLTATGSHTILIDARGLRTGSITLALARESSDSTA